MKKLAQPASSFTEHLAKNNMYYISTNARIVLERRKFKPYIVTVIVGK